MALPVKTISLSLYIIARALQECTAPIAQFLQVIKDMTGWEWTVIGAGPDPHLGGQLNAMRCVPYLLAHFQNAQGFLVTIQE